MGEKTYRFGNLRKLKDFNKKNCLPYLKCVLRLFCVVHGSICGRFMGFYETVFSLYKGLPLYREKTEEADARQCSYFELGLPVVKYYRLE